MTREQKVLKRKTRAKKRADKRAEKYCNFLNSNTDTINYCGFSGSKNGSWYDSDSPTGYSQVCSYFGTCQSPCNGDC
jgi:hypothetical protein